MELWMFLSDTLLEIIPMEKRYVGMMVSGFSGLLSCVGFEIESIGRMRIARGLVGDSPPRLMKQGW